MRCGTDTVPLYSWYSSGVPAPECRNNVEVPGITRLVLDTFAHLANAWVQIGFVAASQYTSAAPRV